MSTTTTQQKQVVEILNTLGAASSIRLAALLGTSELSVFATLANLERDQIVYYCKTPELWVLA